MPRRIGWLLVIVVLTALVLTACGGSDSGEQAATAVQTYLQALVDKDADTLASVACADWEDDATLELDSFQAVETRLDNVVCQASGTDGGSTLVQCQGSIVATYNNEDMALDLSARTYVVANEGGEYRVCGYQ